jgi:hypothetical protein
VIFDFLAMAKKRNSDKNLGLSVRDSLLIFISSPLSPLASLLSLIVGMDVCVLERVVNQSDPHRPLFLA